MDIYIVIFIVIPLLRDISIFAQRDGYKVEQNATFILQEMALINEYICCEYYGLFGTFFDSLPIDDDGDMVSVLMNGTAKVKCDVSTTPLDKVLLVVWYKNNLPIYSYDTRFTKEAAQWRDEELFGSRATVKIDKLAAELIINPVLERDAGNFRCRVDFQTSPTRNSNVNVQVVVPPEIPQIYSEKMGMLQDRVGPLVEGTDLSLICLVRGGTPTPQITWMSRGRQLPGVMVDLNFEATLNSKLVIKNLSRIHQLSVYTCHASNFPRMSVSTNVTIELTLRPLLVEITFENQPLSADRSYDIECRAVGSRPSAKITWWISGQEYEGRTQTVSSDGNISTSLLYYTPRQMDNGKVLVCRATNELIKDEYKETSMKLNVCFIPTVALELGSNLNPDDIEEGDDVYWECKVHANPVAYKVVWKHNGQIIQHNPKAGVIVSSGDLALQSIHRSQAGNYTCVASNVEGDGDSNTVELKVMYRPICRPNQQRIYGVARNEAAKIFCEVDAYPPPETFKWSFNNTAEMIDMPQNGFEKHSLTTSKLTYIPVKEMDYGTIMCWADNAVGQQKDPCVFHLIAAGKPDAPYNCTLINQTSDGLDVECTEGFDGGQRQWFVMEIFDQQSGLLQANISSRYPIFTIGGLDPGRLLRITIFAVNGKGVSDSISLEAFTLKVAEKQTGSHIQFEITSILTVGIVIGVLTAICCIALGTILAIKLRKVKNKRHAGNGQSDSQQGKLRPGNLPIKEKISLPLGSGDMDDLYDDKNPDVVPCNEDIDCKLKSAAQTPAPLQNILHNIVPELLDRPANEQQIYYKTQPDELHYAELSIALPRNYGTAISPTPDNIIGTGDPLMVTTTLPKNPPAYDYFNEPKVYAQIDHFKTMSMANRNQPTIVSPSGAILTPSGYPSQISFAHTYSHPLQTLPFCQASPVDCIAIGNNPAIVPTITTPQLKQSPSLYQANAGHSQHAMVAAATAASQFSREIVTVRTPLLYTQQESCV